MNNRSLCIVMLILMMACAPSSTEVERDLLEHGIPITLMTPDSVAIETMDWGLQKDITLVSPDGFNMQIFSSMTTTPNVKIALADHKELARSNPYFAQFVQEDEDGFIFELTIDSLTHYDFRHLKIQGDREYIFQAGLYGTFSREDIDQMYQVARDAR